MQQNTDETNPVYSLLLIFRETSVFVHFFVMNSFMFLAKSFT